MSTPQSLTEPSAPAEPVGQPFFHYKAGRLHAEGADLHALAREFGTPLYVYSLAALRHAWARYEAAVQSLNMLVCYGMKANSNLSILRQFAQWGSGFDIVSGGELIRALKAGARADRIVFSGVGKQPWEIREALKAGIKCFNVESLPELALIDQIAGQTGIRAPVSLRVNPDVDAGTHPYISTGLRHNKFGIHMEQALDCCRQAQALPHLELVGIDCHIGSQISELAPFHDAVDRLIELLLTLQAEGMAMQHLDIGGGLGIRYQDEVEPDPLVLARGVMQQLERAGLAHLQLVLEPGRSLTGNAGVLLTQVCFLKHNEEHNFAVVDAAMTDLLRPSLYEAWHGILPALRRTEAAVRTYDVVGPVCETGDWLGKKRSLALEPRDLLAVESCGAYGMVMSSQYNSRPRAAEVLVDGDQVHLIRRRETIEDTFGSDILY